MISIVTLSCHEIKLKYFMTKHYITRAIPGTQVTQNSMFARLGTVDYEMRNLWFFTILEAMATD